MYSFDIAQPTSLTAAQQALAAEGAMPLAGGQTLIPTLKARLSAPSTLVSLKAVDGLDEVRVANGEIVVGATAIHADVAAAAAASYPALAWLAGNIGDPAVRNMGTIGGSLANNDPAACYPAAVLASGASITTDRRTIDADAFFLDIFETALEENELITSVSFPIPEQANYQKFEQPASRFALVGVFVARGRSGVRVAVTGASQSGVFRWREAEDALAGNFSAGAIDSLAVDEESMISDLHGSPAYRSHLVKVLTARAVTAA